MRGLVTVIPESVNLYRAVSLDEGLDVLIDEKEKQFVIAATCERPAAVGGQAEGSHPDR